MQKCFLELSPTTQVEKLPGWESLPSSDQATISALVKKAKELRYWRRKQPQSTSTAGAKRKKDVGDDQKSKVSKLEGEVMTRRSGKNADDLDKKPKDSDLESKLEAQTKQLWALKDELKKHVTTAELREILEANVKMQQDQNLICVTAGKWKVPDETNNDFLSKWFKSQKIKKPVRILPPPSASLSQASNGQSQTSKVESLADLKVSMVGLPQESMEEWTGKIKEAGGIVHAKIKNDTNCLVVSGELESHAAEMRKARRMKLPIVREDYLVDCFKDRRSFPLICTKLKLLARPLAWSLSK
ncbi:hypothetical protein GQ457_04G027350 [Hibiscus cannabinus]